MRLLTAVPARSRPALLVAAVLAASSIAGPWATEARADDADKIRRELLAEADRVATAGPYKADWESLKTVPIPEWYLDGKFGIFIHWGLYAVPAFGNEWYPRNMYKADTPEFQHHVATYGPQAQFGYKDFIPRFTAEKYDPAGLGRAVPEGRRAVRRARGRAPRRLRHVRHGASANGARRRWGRSGTSSASWRRPSARRAWSSASPPTAPSTGGSSTRGMTLRLGRAGPAKWHGLLRPRAAGEDARRQAQPARPEYLDDWLARTVRAGGQVPPAARLVRLVDRAARLRALPATVRRLLLQPRRGAGRRRRHQLQEQGLPRRRRGARHRARPARGDPARSSGRPTPRSRRTPGAT